MPSLPLPHPNEETQPFWDYCLRGELRAQKCLACATLRHPPRPLCRCGASEHEWQLLSGRGTVYSYIVTHQPIHPALQGLTPHNVVLVELEEGIRITSNLIDCPHDEIEIGMAVELTFEKVSDDIALPQFRRANEA
jgi:uncharacterized OB-fold protein